jgi:hypothetical protein
VNKLILGRLFESFTELERAIYSAKVTLAAKESQPTELLERIANYERILAKQKSLASALCTFISSGNWEEVDRHVKLINGLSSMIRDDAREIVAGFRPKLSHEEKELMLS